MFPEIVFKHRWADEDIGMNCGERSYLGGEKIDEFIPEGIRATEFALEVWDYDPLELGLAKNSTGTAYVNIENESYQLIELFGKPALFSNDRITPKDIPEGLYCYDLRHSDDGDRFCSVEPKVAVNHGGSVITDIPLDFGEKGYIPFSEDKQRKYLYTEETLQEVCLGINSMCVGAESKYFNGYTNITDDDFLVFGVKGLLDTNKRLKNAMLFNILSFMSNQLLGKGNTAASIDELYLFLTNMTAIEYIRNAMKRVRKKDSSIILASQNIEDFLIPSIREYTKPLFSIPTHQFLFNAGQINPNEYMDALQVEPSEFELIKYPERGICLYRCGNKRYLLQVIAPEYKSALFGKAGGR